MPYFVFAQGAFGRLDKLGEFDAFREASAHAKQLRAAQAAGSAARIRVMFGEHQLAAEDALQQVRVASPQGDD